MKIDYVEVEHNKDKMHFYIGISFADEPDELYVAHIESDPSGEIAGMTLLFNGVDCNYKFHQSERADLVSYVNAKNIIEGKLR